MREKRNRALAALFLALLLTGCGAESVPAAAASAPAERETAEAVTFQAADVKNDMIQPTPEEVLVAYDRAVTAFGWFRLAPLPCGGDPVLVDGTFYQKVDRPGTATMVELKTTLRSLFSDQVVEQLLKEGEGLPLYREIDGALYARSFTGRTDPHKGVVEASVEQTAPDTCVVNVSVELLGTDGSVTGMEYDAFPYRYVDDRWVFTDFRLVNELK